MVEIMVSRAIEHSLLEVMEEEEIAGKNMTSL